MLQLTHLAVGTAWWVLATDPLFRPVTAHVPTVTAYSNETLPISAMFFRNSCNFRKFRRRLSCYYRMTKQNMPEDLIYLRCQSLRLIAVQSSYSAKVSSALAAMSWLIRDALLFKRRTQLNLFVVVSLNTIHANKI